MKRSPFSWLSPGIAAAALLTSVAPHAVFAESMDHLIKASGSTVYYHELNGARHAFPNPSTFRSWYPADTKIASVTDEHLATIPSGEDMLYKPGSTLVKIVSDARVYAVSRYGVLHWITSETLAAELYGARWNTQIVDVSDALFAQYQIGSPITSADQYQRATEAALTSPRENFRDMTPVASDAATTTSATSTKGAVISLAISATRAVLHQSVSVTALVQGSTLPIAKIEIYSTATSTPLATCDYATTCTYTMTVDSAPQNASFSAVAYDASGTAYLPPANGHLTLTVDAPSADLQTSASPQSLSAGSRATFSSLSTRAADVTSHKVFALVPGQLLPLLVKDCSTVKECSGSVPLYRTTDLFSEVTFGDTVLNSAAARVTSLGGMVPAPSMSISGHPAPGQTTLTVTAPTGEGIGQTLIKDGTSLADPTLALCTQSDCSVTLQVNTTSTYTAYTNVGGKYEASNSVIVTP